MNRRFFLPLCGLALLVAFFGLTFSAQASPQTQLSQFATPTPGPDGRIIYIVQPGDTCISISLKTGLPLETMLGQNPEMSCDPLVVGFQIFLGVGGPSSFTPTPGPSPTPTIAPPLPTPFSGTTEVCVLLFDDVNGDALRQETEFGLAGGQVSVTDVNGAYSNAQPTTSDIDLDTLEPLRTCFSDVPEGTFNISVAPPDQYNPTTIMTYHLEVIAGDQAFVDFGAQTRVGQVTDPGTAPTEAGNSPTLGILGGLLLLGGLGMGWYALRLRQTPKKFGGRGINDL